MVSAKPVPVSKAFRVKLAALPEADRIKYDAAAVNQMRIWIAVAFRLGLR